MDNLEKYRKYRIDTHDQPPPSLGKKILLLIKHWRQKSVTKRHLRDLSDYLLDDIGIDKRLSDKETDGNSNS